LHFRLHLHRWRGGWLVGFSAADTCFSLFRPGARHAVCTSLSALRILRSRPLAAKRTSIVEMVPPSLTGESWTFPNLGGADRLANSGRPNLLGDLGKSWPQLGLGRGLDGLARPSVNRGPVVVPDGAQFGEHVFANHAGSRAYKLYVPSGYYEQPLPLW
jgi:hypothetical protein